MNIAATLGGSALPGPLEPRIISLTGDPIDLVLYGDLNAPTGAMFGFTNGTAADIGWGSFKCPNLPYCSPDHVGVLVDLRNVAIADLTQVSITSVLRERPVPEPGSMMLTLFGLSALFARRGRQGVRAGQ